MNYVIWSEEHGGWWRSGHTGYTRSLAKAGRYTRSEAEEIEKIANEFIDPQTGVTFNEVAIPDPFEKL